MRSIPTAFLVILLALEVFATSGFAEGPEPASTRADFFRDDFTDGSEVTLSGDTTVVSGDLTLDPKLAAKWTDTFTRTSLAPWTENDRYNQGSATIVNNELKVQAGYSSGAWVKAERTIDEGVLTVDLSLKVTTIGLEGFSCQFLTASGWGIDFDYYQPTREVRLMTGQRGSFSSIRRASFNLQTGTWYDVSITITGSQVTCEIGSLSFTNSVTFSSNVTVLSIGMDRNGVGYFDDVSLRVPTTYYGEAVSSEIQLPEGNMWNLLQMDRDVPSTTYLFVDVLDGTTNETVPGLRGLRGEEVNISGIDPDLHGSIRLKATLYSYSMNLPKLNWWSVSIMVRSYQWMEAFDSAAHVAATDDVDVLDGRLTTGSLILATEFDGYTVDPWNVVSGTGGMHTGTLRLFGPARIDRDTKRFVEVYAYGQFKPVALGGGEITMEFVSMTGERLVFTYDDGSHLMHVAYDNGTLHILDMVSCTLSEGATCNIHGIYDGTNITFSIGAKEIIVTAPGMEPFDGVALSAGSGNDVHWNFLTMTTLSESGTALSEPIQIPRYCSWDRLELVSSSGPHSVLNVSIVDGDTLEAIPGFERINDELVTLEDINPRTHPRIRLAFEMAAEEFDIPLVDWCRVHTTITLNAVRQVKVIDDVTLVEDTPVHRVLDLRDYFDSLYTPPDEMWYNVSWRSDPEHVFPYLEGFELSIDLPEANWNGYASFKVNCSNEDHTLETGAITVTVTAVNDPLVVGQLQSLYMDEEKVTTYDLSPYIQDVDTPIGEMIVTTDSDHCTVRGTNLTLFYEEGGITETVTVTISDGTTVETRELVVTVRQVNDPPYLLPVPMQVFTEDVVSTVDLSGYILDEDTPVSDMVVTCEHPALTGIEGQVLTFLFTTYSPQQEVGFTIFDGDTTVTGSFRIQVKTINDPPAIVGIGDATAPYVFYVDEGEDLELPVLVVDEDTTRFYYGVTSDWEGLSMSSDGTLRISSTKGEVGTFAGTVEVDDRGGGVDRVTVTVQVRNVNDPPVAPIILEPTNGTHVEEGTNVTFRVQVDDPDLPLGDVLQVTLSSNASGFLGTLASTGDDVVLTTDQLAPGVHTISVTVSDGALDASAWVTVIVEERYVPPPDDGPDEPGTDTESENTSFNLFLIAAIAALAVVAVVVVLTMLRTGPQAPPPPPPPGF